MFESRTLAVILCTVERVREDLPALTPAGGGLSLTFRQN